MKTRITVFVLVAFWGILPGVAQNSKDLTLEELAEKVTGKPLALDSHEKAIADFQKLLEKEAFAPSVELKRNVDSYTKILSILVSVPMREKWDFDKPKMPSVLSAVSTFLSKMDATIEENYKWQRVPLNASPPPGIPMAAAGMDPNQIKDPELKRQYLATIADGQAKNLKNSQQGALQSARHATLIIVQNLLDLAKEKGVSREKAIQAVTPPGKSRQLLVEKLSRVEGGKDTKTEK